MPTLTKRLPEEWETTSELPDGSELYIDPRTKYLDQPTVLFSSPKATENQSLFLWQTIDGNALFGKRVRFSCQIKTKKVVGHATISVSAKGFGGQTVVYDPMFQRSLSGDNEWTELSVVVDIPPEGRWIAFGPRLWGKGKMWAAHFKIEEVSKDIPRTDDHGGSFTEPHPLNLDFSQTTANGLHEGPCDLAAGWQGSSETDGLKLSVLENYFEGCNVALIDSRQTAEVNSIKDRFGFFCQSFQAKPFRGGRLKFSSMIKTEGVVGRVVLVLMVHGVHQNRLALSTMSAEALFGDNDWASYNQVLDVSEFAYSVTIWLQITGFGKAYFARPAVEAVDESVPRTDGHHHPKNLNFFA